MIDSRSVEELDAKGYSHIEAACAQPLCGNLVQYPFRMLLQRKNVDRTTTVAQLGGTVQGA